jgi:hypothetical protein
VFPFSPRKFDLHFCLVKMTDLHWVKNNEKINISVRHLDTHQFRAARATTGSQIVRFP